MVRTRPAVRLWFYWLLANVLGFGIGTLVAVASSDVVFATLPGVVAEPVQGAIHGGALGLAQWLIVRRQLRSAGWWIPASIVGWSVIPGMELAAIMLGGLALGLAQWLVLVWRGTAGSWWIPASMVAWLIGWNVGGNLGNALFNRFVEGQVRYSLIEVASARALGDAAGGAIYGAITGLVLVWLVQRQQQPYLTS